MRMCKEDSVKKLGMWALAAVLAFSAAAWAGERPSVTVQKTSSVDVGPFSFARSCDTSGDRKCTNSVAVSGGGVTVSKSSSGDTCVGVSERGGTGVYGKASAVQCWNNRDGSTATKVSTAVGVGGGADAVSVGATAGVTFTQRTHASGGGR